MHTPSFCTLDAQKNWSLGGSVSTYYWAISVTAYPNQGRIRVGIPAAATRKRTGGETERRALPRKLAPVVPAPPWCNAASICGNSQLHQKNISKRTDGMVSALTHSCGTLSNYD